MSLCLLNLETLKETAFGLPNSASQLPDYIYPGWDGECWFKEWDSRFQYCRFRPNEGDGSFVFWNGSQGDGSAQNVLNSSQETVNVTSLYAGVVNQAIAEHGLLLFGGSEYECYPFLPKKIE